MPIMSTPLSSASFRFAAMGSDVHVVIVDGPPGLELRARDRIEELESRWSRFRSDSEVSRVNRADGRPVLVSADTLAAVEAAVEAWHATEGRFDPTVLPVLVALGYDRDFESVPLDVPHDAPGANPPGPAPGCAGIVVDAIVSAVTLPAGVAIDLGGIGKGLAADLLVTELKGAGAAGACVNVGGDLCVWGRAPSDAGWVVDVEHLPDVRIALGGGGIATSSPSKRRWKRNNRVLHHLIDPRQGRPADAGLAAVTVIAGSAAQAETLTKAAFVSGVGGAAAIIEASRATGVLVTDTGVTLPLPGVEEFLR
jgi:thiamine biosynthesis lipoprotein